LKHASAGFFRDAFQHFLAVLRRFLRIAAGATASHSSTIPSVAAAAVASKVAGLFSFEVDAIHESVGALCRFDCALERGLASAIVAVSEEYESLASLLLLH